MLEELACACLFGRGSGFRLFDEQVQYLLRQRFIAAGKSGQRLEGVDPYDDARVMQIRFQSGHSAFFFFSVERQPRQDVAAIVRKVLETA